MKRLNASNTRASRSNTTLEHHVLHLASHTLRHVRIDTCTRKTSCTYTFVCVDVDTCKLFLLFLQISITEFHTKALTSIVRDSDTRLTISPCHLDQTLIVLVKIFPGRRSFISIINLVLPHRCLFEIFRCITFTSVRST